MFWNEYLSLLYKWKYIIIQSLIWMDMIKCFESYSKMCLKWTKNREIKWIHEKINYLSSYEAI